MAASRILILVAGRKACEEGTTGFCGGLCPPTNQSRLYRYKFCQFVNLSFFYLFFYFFPYRIYFRNFLGTIIYQKKVQNIKITFLLKKKFFEHFVCFPETIDDPQVKFSVVCIQPKLLDFQIYMVIVD